MGFYDNHPSSKSKRTTLYSNLLILGGFMGAHYSHLSLFERRNIPQLLREGGFKLGKLETMYLPATPKIAGFTYWGYAD